MNPNSRQAPLLCSSLDWKLARQPCLACSAQFPASGYPPPRMTIAWCTLFGHTSFCRSPLSHRPPQHFPVQFRICVLGTGHAEWLIGSHFFLQTFDSHLKYSFVATHLLSVDIHHAIFLVFSVEFRLSAPTTPNDGRLMHPFRRLATHRPCARPPSHPSRVLRRIPPFWYRPRRMTGTCCTVWGHTSSR